MKSLAQQTHAFGLACRLARLSHGRSLPNQPHFSDRPYRKCHVERHGARSVVHPGHVDSAVLRVDRPARRRQRRNLGSRRRRRWWQRRHRIAPARLHSQVFSLAEARVLVAVEWACRVQRRRFRGAECRRCDRARRLADAGRDGDPVRARVVAARRGKAAAAGAGGRSPAGKRDGGDFPTARLARDLQVAVGRALARRRRSALANDTAQTGRRRCWRRRRSP